MVEISIDECLPQIARGLAIVRHLSSGRICFAHRDARKIADVEPSEVGRRFRGTWIAGTDVQWGRERVIADIRRVVASSACALKRRNAARHQAAGQCVIVDARHARNVNGLRIKNLLSTRNRRSRVVMGKSGPGIEWVENGWCKLPIIRQKQSARLFQCRYQWMDAGVDADEERLTHKWQRTAARSMRCL